MMGQLHPPRTNCSTIFAYTTTFPLTICCGRSMLSWNSVNFVSTCDLIGGSSGSPVINEDREIVGIIFDGNQESLLNLFVFRDDVPRGINVHSSAILETLEKVYDNDALVAELLGEDGYQ